VDVAVQLVLPLGIFVMGSKENAGGFEDRALDAGEQSTTGGLLGNRFVLQRISFIPNGRPTARGSDFRTGCAGLRHLACRRNTADVKSRIGRFVNIPLLGLRKCRACQGYFAGLDCSRRLWCYPSALQRVPQLIWIHDLTAVM